MAIASDVPLVVSTQAVTSIPTWVMERVAIEYVDETRLAMELVDAIESHLSQGKEQVWVVYLTTCLVTVREAKYGRGYRLGDVLDGGTALPGFSIPVIDLYHALSIELPRHERGVFNGAENDDPTRVNLSVSRHRGKRR